ncbi:protein phosphatase 1 regulatory subunit 42 isoform X2 [Hydra vulgaris]|uniref:Protein phosphatase 1 regulatory subunit 42 isoform X2 n=1 Tax=Hydra vulgaris TaxID=6087 RepID=A0ABM4D8T8_HYDVU
MVRISVDLLLKYASHTKRRSNESDQQYLKRLTHIYFQEKNIDEIDCLSQCKNLCVLYLYDNNISIIKNLEFAGFLTHLYLQQNQIQQLNGLHHLTSLQKLYLSHNQIKVVEGLENCRNLNELHIDYQKLPCGEKLLFDPRSLQAIANCLSVLNVSGNHLDVIGDLSILYKLNQLLIENNDLNELSDLLNALKKWPSLNKLNIVGNPLCHIKKYKESIIVTSKSLVMIDNKEVNESLRLFLCKLYSTKEARKNKEAILEETRKFKSHKEAIIETFSKADIRNKSLQHFNNKPYPHKTLSVENLLKYECKYVPITQ